MTQAKKNTVVKNIKVSIWQLKSRYKCYFFQPSQYNYFPVKFLFCLLCFFQCFFSYAQFPDYYVYLVKGAVTVRRTGANPVQIKQHDLIYDDDEVALTRGAEVTLVDKDANFILLKSPPQSYKASTLTKVSSRRKTDDITAKYLKLLWSELLDPNEDYTKFREENLTVLAGSVSRGNSNCGNLIFPVNGLKTSEDTIHFTWLQTSPSSSYTLFIYDGEGKEVIKMHVKDTQSLIVKRQISEAKPGKYYWIVKSNDGTCEDEIPPYFELMTRENEDKLVTSLIANNGDTVLESRLQIIDKLEKKALIYPILHYYANLVNNNPNDIALRKSYVLFLLKYGFNKEALHEWQQVKNN